MFPQLTLKAQLSNIPKPKHIYSIFAWYIAYTTDQLSKQCLIYQM